MDRNAYRLYTSPVSLFSIILVAPITDFTMKKIVLVLPDTVVKHREVRRKRYREEIELTPETLLKVLTTSGDYHTEYFFENEADIIIESVGVVPDDTQR